MDQSMKRDSNGGSAAGQIKEHANTRCEMVFSTDVKVQENGIWTTETVAIAVVLVVPLITDDAQSEGSGCI